jgi:formate hydrogenlyase subunit 4
MRNHHGRPGPAYLQVEREFVKKMRKKRRKERLAIFFVVVGGVVVATAVAWTALWH